MQASDTPYAQATAFTQVCLEQLRKSLHTFSADTHRDQYHTPRNLLLAMIAEVSASHRVVEQQQEGDKFGHHTATTTPVARTWHCPTTSPPIPHPTHSNSPRLHRLTLLHSPPPPTQHTDRAACRDISVEGGCGVFVAAQPTPPCCQQYSLLVVSG